MLKRLVLMLLVITSIFLLDQTIKALFVNGVRAYTDCIDLILVYNKGVAFSMFAFLEESLKWIQLALLAAVIGYTLWLKKVCYLIPVGIMVGAGASNIYDRFIHGGVVDYVYWHCGFNFAVFNFADVMIDIAVLSLFILNYKPHYCKG
jgi:signal peptidase II